MAQPPQGLEPHARPQHRRFIGLRRSPPRTCRTTTVRRSIMPPVRDLPTKPVGARRCRRSRSGAVGTAKPDRDLPALDRLATDPARTLYVGDTARRCPRRPELGSRSCARPLDLHRDHDHWRLRPGAGRSARRGGRNSAAGPRIVSGAQGFRSRPTGADRRHLRRVMARSAAPARFGTGRDADQYLPLFARWALRPQPARLAPTATTSGSRPGVMRRRSPTVDEPCAGTRRDAQLARPGKAWPASRKTLATSTRCSTRCVSGPSPQANSRTPTEQRRLVGSRSDGSAALDWLFRVGEVGSASPWLRQGIRPARTDHAVRGPSSAHADRGGGSP